MNNYYYVWSTGKGFRIIQVQAENADDALELGFSIIKKKYNFEILLNDLVLPAPDPHSVCLKNQEWKDTLKKGLEVY